MQDTVREREVLGVSILNVGRVLQFVRELKSSVYLHRRIFRIRKLTGPSLKPWGIDCDKPTFNMKHFVGVIYLRVGTDAHDGI